VRQQRSYLVFDGCAQLGRPQLLDLHFFTLGNQHGVKERISTRQRHGLNRQGKRDFVSFAAEGDATTKERFENSLEVLAVVRKGDTGGKQFMSRQMTYQTDQCDHEEFDLVPVVVACNVDILESDDNIGAGSMSQMQRFIGYPTVARRSLQRVAKRF
jgi:hypothetical protein